MLTEGEYRELRRYLIRCKGLTLRDRVELAKTACRMAGKHLNNN